MSRQSALHLRTPAENPPQPHETEKRIGTKCLKHHSIIFLLSKKMLCYHYNCTPRMLAKYGFPDYILREIGMTRDEYRKVIGNFTPEMSKKIFAAKGINWLRVPHF